MAQRILRMPALGAVLVFSALGGVAVNEQIDAVFGDVARTDSPGCAVGVVQEGKLVFEKGYGMASLELGVPNSPEMVYYAGSVSKEFVAASIALAARDGSLSLDDPVTKYVPEMPPYAARIRIRHLIHHTSGIRDYLELMLLAGMPWQNLYSNDEILGLIVRQRSANFEAGEKYSYSNSGYYLLAEILRRATGKTLRQFARERIFDPLGMRDSYFHDDRNEVTRKRAMAYSPADGSGYSLEWYPNFDKVGSGGLMTTVRDLARWDGNFDSGTVGGPEFLREMVTPGVFNDGRRQEYGFGLVLGQYRGLPRIGHTGSFMGFRAAYLRFPDQRLSVLCLCNLSSAEPERRVEKVAEIFLGDRMSAAAPAKEAKEELGSTGHEQLPAGMANEFAGEYWSPELRTWYNVRVDGGDVRLEKTPTQPGGILQPGAGGSLRLRNLVLRFEGANDGKRPGFVLEAGPIHGIRFERQAPR